MLAVAAAEAPLAAAVILSGRIALCRVAAAVRQRKFRAATAILPPTAGGPFRDPVRRRAVVHTGGTATMVGGRAAVAPLAAAGVGAGSVTFAGSAAVGQREFGAAAAVHPYFAHQQWDLLTRSASATGRRFLK